MFNLFRKKDKVEKELDSKLIDCFNRIEAGKKNDIEYTCTRSYNKISKIDLTDLSVSRYLRTPISYDLEVQFKVGSCTSFSINDRKVVKAFNDAIKRIENTRKIKEIEESLKILDDVS